MTCTIIAAVVTCTMLGPTPSPADAAKILTAAIPPAVALASEARGPYLLGGAYYPPVPAFSEYTPARRLDGSYVTDPPFVYGDLYGAGFLSSGYGGYGGGYGGFRGNRFKGGVGRHAPAPALPSRVRPAAPPRPAPVRPPAPRPGVAGSRPMWR